MREKIALLLFPTTGRMDHTIPAIRHIQERTKNRGAEKLVVEFLPLNDIASQNLPKFLKSIEDIHKKELESEKLSSIYSNYLCFESRTEFISLGDWGRILEEIIEDVKATSIFVGCTVALGSDVPEEIALETSVTSLSHSDLTMIKIPTGYDIQTPPELFKPGARLSEQIIHHELLGSLSIREPLIFVAKNNVVREVLMSIRKLYDQDKSTGGFKSQVILKEINSHRSKVEMSSTNLSNNLKHLRSYNLITSESAKHEVTKKGIILSGILSD
ncbi:MAG: hypothetical protein HOK72_13205 [Flavobacteriales bacterium]|jgi:hypothetical protein|nr:hypothetical protein [Flavobacteriales bacterium]